MLTTAGVKVQSPNFKKYRTFELDTDKIESVDDCKEILKFLCSQVLGPLEEELMYSGFDKVEKYFK